MGYLSEIWANLKNFILAIWKDICNTYQRVKIFLFVILVTAIYLGWDKLKSKWLVESGQEELKSDEKQDQNLSVQEKNVNDQANVLIQEANRLPSTEVPVQSDWYEKDKK